MEMVRPRLVRLQFFLLSIIALMNNFQKKTQRNQYLLELLCVLPGTWFAEL